MAALPLSLISRRSALRCNSKTVMVGVCVYGGFVLSLFAPRFGRHNNRRIQTVPGMIRRGMAFSTSSSPGSALYIRTPLIHSLPLSRRIGKDVYLKLDCLQPTGSFKDRGLSEFVKEKQNAKRIISSSGGNAGHAAAWAGNSLGLNVTVVVPKSAPKFMVDKIKSHGAEVIVHGDVWKDADNLVQEMVAKDPEAAYISPYDHPVIWEGHKSMIEEVYEDFKTMGEATPSAVVCCVGGGGMLCGIYDGLVECGWGDYTSVVTAETAGAASFAKSVHSGEHVTLEKIETIASTLAAPKVADGVIERMKSYKAASSVANLPNIVGTHAVGDVSDPEAVQACVSFSRDHRFLVEPSCGAALSLLYNDRHKSLFDASCRSSSEERGTQRGEGPIVMIVCGGGGVDMSILNGFQKKLGLTE